MRRRTSSLFESASTINVRRRRAWVKTRVDGHVSAFANLSPRELSCRIHSSLLRHPFLEPAPGRSLERRRDDTRTLLVMPPITTPGSPSVESRHALLFSADEFVGSEPASTGAEANKEETPPAERQSMYVKLFAGESGFSA